jgi:hypothetical protein
MPDPLAIQRSGTVIVQDGDVLKIFEPGSILPTATYRLVQKELIPFEEPPAGGLREGDPVGGPNGP